MCHDIEDYIGQLGDTKFLARTSLKAAEKLIAKLPNDSMLETLSAMDSQEGQQIIDAVGQWKKKMGVVEQFMQAWLPEGNAPELFKQLRAAQKADLPINVQFVELAALRRTVDDCKTDSDWAQVAKILGLHSERLSDEAVSLEWLHEATREEAQSALFTGMLTDLSQLCTDDMAHLQAGRRYHIT